MSCFVFTRRVQILLHTDKRQEVNEQATRVHGLAALALATASTSALPYGSLLVVSGVGQW